MLQDLRLALRTLLRSPGFTSVAVLTMALGIGANAAIFSLVDAHLVRPLPYPHPERLVRLLDVQPGYGEAPFSFEEWRDLLEHGRAIEAPAAFYRINVNDAGGELPERLRLLLVDGPYFDLVGLAPLAGRLFSPEEEREGGPPAVVAGESFFKTRLGGRAEAVGGVLRLSDRPYTMVGVVPDPPGPSSGPLAAALYAPLAPNAPWRDRGTHYLGVVARLPEGTALPAARAAMDALAARLMEERGTDHGVAMRSLRDHLVGDARGLLVTLLGAGGFVLLIAAGNVANLLLVRAADRDAEFAVRLALGAGRWRLARQLLAEGLVLGAAAAAAGALLGAWGTTALVRILPGSLALPGRAGFDVRTLAFTLAAALATAVLAGLAPALVEARRPPAAGLAGARAPGGSARARRTRGGLVVAELALSLVLLIGAGLLIQSFQRLQRADPGFQARGLLAASLDLPDARYPGPAQRLAFAEDAAARIGRLPGVSGVAAANNLPLEGSMNGVVEVEGRAFEPDDRPNAEKRIVGDDYFRVMEIPLRAGRLFGPSDREGSPKVVIVSETAARRLWPGDTAVGKRIRSLTCGECWEEVVGVVGDVKEEALHRAAPMEIYYPLRQLPLGAMELVIRAGGDPEALVEPVRRAVAELDPTQPVHGIRTLRDVVAASVEDRRVSSFLLGAFAALAVLLAAVGVGGVVSYAVGRRTREIGLRMALGSTPRAVVRLVLGHGLRLAAGGLALGLPAALVLVRLLRAQLYEVEPGHPAAYLGGAALLALAVLAACYLPARRAARVDPLAALRYE